LPGDGFSMKSKHVARTNTDKCLFVADSSYFPFYKSLINVEFSFDYFNFRRTLGHNVVSGNGYISQFGPCTGAEREHKVSILEKNM
jgi:hypothetical protein